MRSRGAWALALALAGLLAPAIARADQLAVAAGGGARLVVERSPFALRLVDRSGAVELSSAAGANGLLLPPAIDGPEPVDPLGSLGGFPALGWVVGVAPGILNPAPPFTGNRLLGADAGAIVAATAVTAAGRLPGGGLELVLATNDPAAGPATAELTPLRGGGVLLRATAPPALRSVVATMTTLRSPPGEGLYGLGTRRDAFDQRGLLRNAWVEEQYFGDETTEPVTGLDPTGLTGPAYTAPNGAQMAFTALAELSGSRGWTAWVEQPELQRLDLAASRRDSVRWGVAADHIALGIAGGGLERSLRSYSARAGRAPAPPRFALEPWIDRINQNGEGEAAPNGGGYRGGPAVRASLLDFARRVRSLGLPVRTFGVEGWQTVPGGGELFASLRRQGFHLMAYWNPFLAPGKPVTREAQRLGVVIADASGRPFQIVTNRQNFSYAVDFSAPRAQQFWDEQIARSCALGFEGTHADFGEFVIDGMRFADGSSVGSMHNRYPLLYARATRIALDRCARRRHQHRPFFYVRAGFGPVPGAFASLSQTPAVIVGDETTDFSRGSGLASLPAAMLNLALAGGSVFVSDIGGYFDLYTPSTSAELFRRWSQLAALTPVMRVHDDTEHGSRYPWSYDAGTLEVYRRYARFHVRLIPLLQRWLARGARDGAIGPVRPLVLDDGSPAARSIWDEWLLGRDLLVAPVLARGARTRSVYLPAGSAWQRVTVSPDGRLARAGVPLAGGRRVVAALDATDIPLFVRAASPALAGDGPAIDPKRLR